MAKTKQLLEDLGDGLYRINSDGRSQPDVKITISKFEHDTAHLNISVRLPGANSASVETTYFIPAHMIANLAEAAKRLEIA